MAWERLSQNLAWERFFFCYIDITAKISVCKTPWCTCWSVKMSPEVWSDFVRVDDRVGPSKQQHNGTASETRYACWRCPHCSEHAEVAVADGGKLQKSIACRWHFWNATTPCPNRPVSDVRGKPATKRKSIPRSPSPIPDGNEADVSDAGSPHASPSLRERPGGAQPAIAEGVPVPPTEEELRVKLLEQQLDTERKRAATAEAAYDAETHRAKIYRERYRRLMEDAEVSPAESNDADEIADAKRRRVGEGPLAAAFGVVAVAADASPMREGEERVVFCQRVRATVRDNASESRKLHRVRSNCKDLVYDASDAERLQDALEGVSGPAQPAARRIGRVLRRVQESAR